MRAVISPYGRFVPSPIHLDVPRVRVVWLMFRRLRRAQSPWLPASRGKGVNSVGHARLHALILFLCSSLKSLRPVPPSPPGGSEGEVEPESNPSSDDQDQNLPGTNNNGTTEVRFPLPCAALRPYPYHAILARFGGGNSCDEVRVMYGQAFIQMMLMMFPPSFFPRTGSPLPDDGSGRVSRGAPRMRSVHLSVRA